MNEISIRILFDQLFLSFLLTHWKTFNDLGGRLPWQKLKKSFVDGYAQLVPARRATCFFETKLDRKCIHCKLRHLK